MRKINWGVMGTAGIAKGQTIPGMQQAENCNLYAIAGRSLEKAQAFQKEFGFEKAYIPSDMTGFYERYGYRKIDSLVNYGGDTDLLYAKDLR